MLNINSALVNNALEIFNLLKNIQKSKQLISLSFVSLPQYCLTSLLEVHHDTKSLIFDEPNPRPSSKLTDTKTKAKFTLKLDQLPIIFEANIILNNNELHTNFPNYIYYPQNRSYYRFSTEYIKNIRATVFLSSTTRLPCEVLNISLDGICLRFSYSYAKLFQVNQLIDDIYIELSNQSGFSISGIEKVIQQFIFQTENV